MITTYLKERQTLYDFLTEIIKELRVGRILQRTITTMEMMAKIKWGISLFDEHANPEKVFAYLTREKKFRTSIFPQVKRVVEEENDVVISNQRSSYANERGYIICMIRPEYEVEILQKVARAKTLLKAAGRAEEIGSRQYKELGEKYRMVLETQEKLKELPSPNEFYETHYKYPNKQNKAGQKSTKKILR